MSGEYKMDAAAAADAAIEAREDAPPVGEIGEEVLAHFRGEDESDEEWAASRAAIAREMGGKPEDQPAEATPPADGTASDDAVVAADDQPATGEERTKLETALEALRRDGWTEEELNKLARKTILSKGLKRAKVQTDTDEMQADLRRLKSEREKVDAKPVEAAQPAQLPADLAALSKAFTDEGLSEGVSKTLVATLQSWRQEQDTEVKSLRGALIEMHVESARREVAERFRDLMKADVWTEAREMAEFIETKKPGQTAAWYIEEAAKKLRLSNAPAVARAEEARAESRVRKNGTPEVAARASPKPAVNGEDAEYQAWSMRMRGAPVDDAVRVMKRT